MGDPLFPDCIIVYVCRSNGKTLSPIIGEFIGDLTEKCLGFPRHLIIMHLLVTNSSQEIYHTLSTVCAIFPQILSYHSQSFLSSHL
jgi:hypothetical protein